MHVFNSAIKPTTWYISLTKREKDLHLYLGVTMGCERSINPHLFYFILVHNLISHKPISLELNMNTFKTNYVKLVAKAGYGMPLMREQIDALLV